MPIKVVTSFKTLMTLARAEAEARKSGDPEKIEEATRQHREYHSVCLKSDEIIVDALQHVEGLLR